MSKIVWILWPSFLAAGLAEFLFFSVIEPQDVRFFGQPTELSSVAAYSIGFFFFWAACALSSLTTCFFQRRGEDINREAGGHAAAAPNR